MEYNAKAIQQLTFREGVRKRVGIYLGSADHTGVIAGLLELVNNATDEALVCPTATKIELEIGSDWATWNRKRICRLGQVEGSWLFEERQKSTK